MVYLSFESLSGLSEKQVKEILKMLEESGRPFLWVLRKNNKGEVIEEKFKKIFSYRSQSINCNLCFFSFYFILFLKG